MSILNSTQAPSPALLAGKRMSSGGSLGSSSRTTPRGGPSPSGGNSLLKPAPHTPPPLLPPAAGSKGNDGRRRSSNNRGHDHSDVSSDEEDVLEEDLVDALKGSDERQVAWQCGACRYCMLAIDHRGKVLPISLNAFGDPIPIQCPRCLASHTSWSITTPFDPFGNHVNVKGVFASRLGLPAAPVPAATHMASARSSLGQQSSTANSSSSTIAAPSPPPLPSAGSLLDNLPPILASIGLVTYRNGVPKSTVPVVTSTRKQRVGYFCGLCNRRLLRIDHNGDLVPLDTQAGGEIVPLTCPGCGVSHTDWPAKPF